jgi:hypothetical protein
MIDSRNSSARGKRSHIAGIDTSSFGYRPATEGTFLLNTRCWLAGDPFNFDPIVFPRPAYFSPRSRVVVELAEPLRSAGSSSVASQDKKRWRKKYGLIRNSGEMGSKEANDRRYQVVLAENEET